MINNVTNATINATKQAAAAVKVDLIHQIFTLQNMSILAAVFFVLLIGLVMLVINAGPYFWFGLRLNRLTSKYGASNIGLMFLRNKGNNIPFPQIIDLRSFKIERKTDQKTNTYLYAREQLEGGKFFGLPYVIYNDDDNKTSIGLYYHNSDTNGNPMFEEVLRGYDENKKAVYAKRPFITAIKPAVTLPPEYYRAIIDGERLSKAISDFLEKYQMMLYVIGGVGLLVIAVGFIAYTIHSKDVPQMLNACKVAANSCKTVAEGLLPTAHNGTVVLR